MITIGLMRGSGMSGVIKKMLHVPTLKLYAVKEQPIINRTIRKSLKDWLNEWKSTI